MFLLAPGHCLRTPLEAHPENRMYQVLQLQPVLRATSAVTGILDEVWDGLKVRRLF